MWIYVFIYFGYIHRIAGSYGSSVFYFLRTCQTIFTADVPFNILTSNVCLLQFLHILTNICYYLGSYNHARGCYIGPLKRVRPGAFWGAPLDDRRPFWSVRNESHSNTTYVEVPNGVSWLFQGFCREGGNCEAAYLCLPEYLMWYIVLCGVHPFIPAAL